MANRKQKTAEKSQKALPADGKLVVSSAVRAGWRKVKLGDIADVQWGDTSTTKASYKPTGFTAFSATGPDGFMDHFDFDREGVVLSAIGANCGDTWLARGKWSAIKNTIVFWANSGKSDTKFLFYKTHNKRMWPNRGSAQPFVSQGDAREMELLIPENPADQKRIADILSTFDDKIELNNKTCRALEQMAQEIFKEWFVMNASQCEELPFTDQIEILGGGTPSTRNPEYWNGNIPFFAPGDATTGFYVVSTEKHITEIGLQKCNSRLHPKDTVFITARGTVGKVALTGVPMAMNQSCYAFESKGLLSNHFIFLLVKQAVRELQKQAVGGVFDTITTATFKNMKITVPTPQVLEKFDRLIVPIFEKILCVQRENQRLVAMRDLLLPRLMNGTLSVP